MQQLVKSCGLPLACCCILVTASSKTAANAGLITQAGLGMFCIVAAVHIAAMGTGYAAAALLKLPEQIRRCCAVQAGERNPAFGLIVANSCLAAAGGAGSGALAGFSLMDVLAPCATAVFMQNCIGSVLATAWSSRERGLILN
jgi:predicted Na+-dependent transporter